MSKKTLVINLFSGPGCGKSTVAAGLFYKLKCHGFYDCELVTEFAKDLIWGESTKCLNNQSYIFGEQYFRIWRLDGKVDIIITDSPLLLCINYETNKTKEFEDLIISKNNEFNNINIFLERFTIDEFNENGRVHTYKESLDKDNEILETLNKHNIEYKKASGTSEEKTEKIFKYILKCVKDI